MVLRLLVNVSQEEHLSFVLFNANMQCNVGLNSNIRRMIHNELLLYAYIEIIGDVCGLYMVESKEQTNFST